MATEILVPTLGESVTTATVARWLKKAGEAVAVDEPLVELETDKVSVEVPSPSAGTLSEQTAAEGAEVEVGAVLGMVEAGGAAAKPATEPKPAEAKAATQPAANPAAGVNPPPRPSGPVARPATPPADVATHAPLPAAAKIMTEKRVWPPRQVGRWLRQGRADHQGRRAGLPQHSGPAPTPPDARGEGPAPVPRIRARSG